MFPHTPIDACPSERYAALAAAGELVPEAAQQRIARQFDALCEALVERPSSGISRLTDLKRLWFSKRFDRQPRPPVEGIYLWGNVGRGKTMLMDIFHDSLASVPKQRLHFHRLMRRVHEQLAQLAGQRNPLRLLAERLADEARVLCVDEFCVSDIGDAMILGELLDALFSRGVTLVATSNLHPQRLYENGLQRRRFLPAIDLLLRHTRVFALEDGEDYRLRLLRDAGSYHWPADDETDDKLMHSFERLTDEPIMEDAAIEVMHRIIRARRVSGGIAMFGFHDLCETARSQNDYIELSRLYHTIVVTHVPVMTAAHESAARRFIALVDELYDRSVNLMLSAEAPVQGLYVGTRHKESFERCASRLIEMRSVEYMERMHKA